MNRFITTSILTLTAGTAVYAADISVTPSYFGSYDAGDNPLGVLDLTQESNRDPSIYHQFDFLFSMSNMAAGEDFGAVGWNVVLGAGLVEAGFGYAAADPTYDPPGPSTSADFYSNNADLGASDLQGLFADASASAANIVQAGESGPFPLGSVYVRFAPDYDGASSVGVTAPVGDPFQIFTGNGTGTGSLTAGSAENYVGGIYNIGAVPEPASIGLLAIAGLSLIRRRA